MPHTQLISPPIEEADKRKPLPKHFEPLLSDISGGTIGYLSGALFPTTGVVRAVFFPLVRNVSNQTQIAQCHGLKLAPRKHRGAFWTVARLFVVVLVLF